MRNSALTSYTTDNTTDTEENENRSTERGTKPSSVIHSTYGKQKGTMLRRVHKQARAQARAQGLALSSSISMSQQMHTQTQMRTRRVHRKSISQQLESINNTSPSRSPSPATFRRSLANFSGTDTGVDEMRDNHMVQDEIISLNNEDGTAIRGKEDEPTTLQRVENATSILIIILEQIISTVTLLLPNSIIRLCTSASRFVFSLFKSNNEKYNDFITESESSKLQDDVLHLVEKMRNSTNFPELCALHGFKAESHLVHTNDGFNLTVHRLDPKANGFKPNGKAVYLQHGLLMTSDVWCVMLDKDNNLPFVLCEKGYDVFCGNNRGNKYSNKHEKYNADERAFWDFSLDEFAMYDIPAAIDYILKLKGIDHLTYIGFSQGCSQILSSVSINRDLNEKIDKIILVAPATTPKKLNSWLVNSIINFDPEMMYTLFGRKIMVKSIMFWRRITYPPMFIKLIDIPNDMLFNWKSENIDIIQKLVSYYHLFSTTSVKCIVHWFQIIKSKKFQMYQEQDYFQPFEYPTQFINIKKMMIIYGMSDSLVDIDVLVSQLPESKYQQYTQIKDGKVVGMKQLVDNVEIEVDSSSDSDDTAENAIKVNDYESHSELKIFGVYGHEHLDLLWGKNMKENVIDNVVRFLQ